MEYRGNLDPDRATSRERRTKASSAPENSPEDDPGLSKTETRRPTSDPRETSIQLLRDKAALLKDVIELYKSVKQIGGSDAAVNALKSTIDSLTQDMRLDSERLGRHRASRATKRAVALGH
jgi:hypothetical protein